MILYLKIFLNNIFFLVQDDKSLCNLLLQRWIIMEIKFLFSQEDLKAIRDNIKS